LMRLSDWARKPGGRDDMLNSGNVENAGET